MMFFRCLIPLLFVGSASAFVVGHDRQQQQHPALCSSLFVSATEGSSSGRSEEKVLTTIGDDSAAVDLKESKEIAHLQKKLRHFKQEQSDKESAYQRYVLDQNVAQKLKPIYVRVGKIDTYKLRPIFDKNTDEIQTEIWTIKEGIKLTHAKLQEEHRIQQVRDETAQQLASYEGDVKRLKDQLVSSAKRLRVKDVFLNRAKELKQELALAKEEQKRIQKESKSKLKALQNEFATSVEGLQKKSSQRLSEKEKEIEMLANEIQGLVMQLQMKRKELNVKEEVVLNLDSELQQKESRLQSLMMERASLRALAKRSWEVLKTRLAFKNWRWGRKGDVGNKGEVDETSAVKEASAEAHVGEAVVV